MLERSCQLQSCCWSEIPNRRKSTYGNKKYFIKYVQAVNGSRVVVTDFSEKITNGATVFPSTYFKAEKLYCRHCTRFTQNIVFGIWSSQPQSDSSLIPRPTHTVCLQTIWCKLHSKLEKTIKLYPNWVILQNFYRRPFCNKNFKVAPYFCLCSY